MGPERFECEGRTQFDLTAEVLNNLLTKMERCEIEKIVRDMRSDWKGGWGKTEDGMNCLQKVMMKHLWDLMLKVRTDMMRLWCRWC